MTILLAIASYVVLVAIGVLAVAAIAFLIVAIGGFIRCVRSLHNVDSEPAWLTGEERDQ